MQISNLHESRDSFSEALSLTSRSTGFGPRLIEKDYYCSMLLLYLSSSVDSPLVFKGGTCLSKVYTEFFRLSEDIDFCVPQMPGGKRGMRRKIIAPLKRLLEELPERLNAFTSLMPLTGRNESTQYVAEVSYVSMITAQQETIKVEIGLREPIFLSSVSALSNTLLLDPVTAKRAVSPFSVRVLDFNEAMAEKTRAALTRLEPAIRDFFDLDFAVKNHRINLHDQGLIKLVRQKLDLPGNGPINLSLDRRRELENQLQSQLYPVLRKQDFEAFNLDRIWNTMIEFTNKLSSPNVS